MVKVAAELCREYCAILAVKDVRVLGHSGGESTSGCKGKVQGKLHRKGNI